MYARFIEIINNISSLGKIYYEEEKKKEKEDEREREV